MVTPSQKLPSSVASKANRCFMIRPEIDLFVYPARRQRITSYICRSGWHNQSAVQDHMAAMYRLVKHRPTVWLTSTLPIPAEIHARPRLQRQPDNTPDLPTVVVPAMTLAVGALLRIAGQIHARDVVMVPDLSAAQPAKKLSALFVQAMPSL